MEPVPVLRFVTRDLPPPERLPAFRLMTASMYQTWALGDSAAFEVDATGYWVGGLVFNEGAFSPARFRRHQEHRSAHGSDFLVLQEQVNGEERVVMDHGIVRLLPGHLYLRDWGLSFDSQATDMRIRSVVIPRGRMRGCVVLGDGHPVLSWSTADPDGLLFHRLWSELFALLPETDLGVAETMCEGFLGFLDGLLLGSDSQANAPAATLRAMEQYLSVRLRGDVGVGDLCHRFNVSRSTVYRLFAVHGGVSRFLNSQRLRRCFDDLRFANPRRTLVGDVAASWGYLDASAFSRRFRARFGVPPCEVLGSAASAGETDRSEPSHPTPGPHLDYRVWLDRASGKARNSRSGIGLSDHEAET